MKKILAALLCAILLLSCMTAFAASSYIVATGDVNVRSGPGLGYSILGTIRKGGTLDSDGTTSVDSRGVAWYRVYYGSNTYGWVSSVWATLYSGGSGSVVQPGGATYVRATASVNLRSGPGTGYDDIGTLAKGETATYLGSYSTDERGVVWYQVRFEGQTGWVSSRYTALY